MSLGIHFLCFYRELVGKMALVSEDAWVKPTTAIDDSVIKNTIWRKLDLYILPLVSMFYFLSFLVRYYLSLQFILIS